MGEGRARRMQSIMRWFKGNTKKMVVRRYIYEHEGRFVININGRREILWYSIIP